MPSKPAFASVLALSFLVGCGTSSGSGPAADGGTGTTERPMMTASVRGLDRGIDGEVLIAVDNVGGLIEARRRTVNPGGFSNETTDVDVLRKLDPRGNEVWAQNASVTGDSELLIAGIAAGPENETIVVVLGRGSPKLGGQNIPIGGGELGLFLVAFGPEGNFRWLRGVPEKVSVVHALWYGRDALWLAADSGVIAFGPTGNELRRIGTPLLNSPEFGVDGWVTDGDHRVCHGRATSTQSTVVCRNDPLTLTGDPAEAYTLPIAVAKECGARPLRLEPDAKLLARLRGCTIGSDRYDGLVRLSATGEVETKFEFPMGETSAVANDLAFDVVVADANMALKAWRIATPTTLVWDARIGTQAELCGAPCKGQIATGARSVWLRFERQNDAQLLRFQ
jgi:hypothetical protein